MSDHEPQDSGLDRMETEEDLSLRDSDKDTPTSPDSTVHSPPSHNLEPEPSTSQVQRSSSYVHFRPSEGSPQGIQMGHSSLTRASSAEPVSSDAPILERLLRRTPSAPAPPPAPVSPTSPFKIPAIPPLHRRKSNSFSFTQSNWWSKDQQGSSTSSLPTNSQCVIQIPGSPRSRRPRRPGYASVPSMSPQDPSNHSIWTTQSSDSSRNTSEHPPEVVRIFGDIPGPSRSSDDKSSSGSVGTCILNLLLAQNSHPTRPFRVPTNVSSIPCPVPQTSPNLPGPSSSRPSSQNSSRSLTNKNMDSPLTELLLAETSRNNSKLNMFEVPFPLSPINSPEASPQKDSSSSSDSDSS